MVSKIKKLYENWKLSKYYKSIKVVPMLNWIELYESNDISQISKTGKVCSYAGKAYERLQDELIDTFGVNEDFLKIFNNKKRIELLYAHQMETGDRSNGWKIQMLELDNQELANKKTKMDLFESIIAIEKHMGFKINPKELTVFQFYKYSKTIANKLKSELKNG